MRKHSIKIGMALTAVLALTSFAASAAQAETTVPITVLGTTTLLATVTGNVLLTRILVPALNTEIHCVKGSFIETHVVGGIILGKILYEECLGINSIAPLEPLPCLISNGGAKHHITAHIKITALLHHGTVYYIVHGDLPEGLLSTVEFKAGEGCPLPKAVKIKGLYAYTGPQGETLNPLLTPGNQALQTLLIQGGSGLIFGINPAFLDEGVIHLSLAAPHINCPFGAI